MPGDTGPTQAVGMVVGTDPLEGRSAEEAALHIVPDDDV
jgi:hypothetical protein